MLSVPQLSKSLVRALVSTLSIEFGFSRVRTLNHSATPPAVKALEGTPHLFKKFRLISAV